MVTAGPSSRGPGVPTRPAACMASGYISQYTSVTVPPVMAMSYPKTFTFSRITGAQKIIVNKVRPICSQTPGEL